MQNSRQPCSLSNDDSRPLCADTCVCLNSASDSYDTNSSQAQQATSEEVIATDPTLCANPNSNYLDQIRADFTVCALPAGSLSGNCITGEENEPDNCGFSTNLPALCAYCGTSSPNATDSCCIGSNVTGRCDGLTLPTFTTMPPLFTSTSSGSQPSSTNGTASRAAASTQRHGLSGGAIAGIVVGSVIGGLLLLALLAFCCIFLRRRNRDRSQKGSVFNQPQPTRRGPSMQQYAPADGPQNGYEVLPGGRVARMSALQGSSSGSPPGATAVAGMGGPRRGYNDTSDSEAYGDSPESQRVPPVTGKRNASLSSASALATGEDNSPNSGSGGQYSSPEGVASGQSEQLPYFKDYYSTDEIHPNDKVAALWAYQPRAGDEFELERGDMLKVVGIWDDGWATGVRISDRAEDYDGKHKIQRDSGVSNGSAARTQSPPPTGEIKAFPLVCVCLPEAWRKTVEGDGSTESGSGGPPPGI